MDAPCRTKFGALLDRLFGDDKRDRENEMLDLERRRVAALEKIAAQKGGDEPHRAK